MEREDKIRKRKERAKKRADKHNQEYFKRIKIARDMNLPYSAPLPDKYGRAGNWPDSSSPTGYSQVCDYYGICQSPCNGDC